MGGLCIDAELDEQQIWPRQTSRQTLTPCGVLALLHYYDRSLPFIKKKEIEDKSKANNVTKSIVCIQALWFCVQFFGRIGKGFPVSLLELNTFAHSICALAIYILWWEKPLDIDEPIAISTQSSDSIRDFAAITWARGRRSTLNRHWHIIDAQTKTWKAPKTDYAIRDPNNYVGYHLFPENTKLVGQINGLARQKPTKEFLDREPPVPAFKGIDNSLKEFSFVSYAPPVIRLKGGSVIPGTDFTIHQSLGSFEFDEMLLSRLQRSARLEGEDRETMPPILRNGERGAWLAPRISNLQYNGLTGDSYYEFWEPNGKQVIAMTFSGIFYGGLHLLAWGSSIFQTRAESILWAISSVSIFATGAIYMGGGWLMVKDWSCIDPGKERTLPKPRFGVQYWLGIPVVTIVVILPPILYVLARIYLIVEVFISLPRSDPTVYQTPDWSPYWPHVS